MSDIRATGSVQSVDRAVTILELLARHGEMGVTEVAKAVVDAGYMTTAANFRTIVNQCLTKHRKLFKKLGRGKYTAI